MYTSDPSHLWLSWYDTDLDLTFRRFDDLFCGAQAHVHFSVFFFLCVCQPLGPSFSLTHRFNLHILFQSLFNSA